MAASMIIIPAICNGLIHSCSIMYAHSTATGSSIVIRIELIPAPILEIPAANNAVGIVVPTMARNIAQRIKLLLNDYLVQWFDCLL